MKKTKAAKTEKPAKGTKTKKPRNELVGKRVWVLVITHDGMNFTSAYTTLRKVLNSIKCEFAEQGLLEYWDKAKEELKDQWFFHDPSISPDTFLIDCTYIW